MEGQFDFAIEGRSFTAIRQANDENTDNELSGCFDLIESDKSHGWLCFGNETYECTDCNELSEIELAMIAEQIYIQHYKHVL